MKRILIIEDDTVIAYGLVYALEQEGYSVILGNSVSEATKIISKNKFDIAILDMQLPDGTGFDVSEELKGSDTAIIFLTVVDEENKIVSAFEGGAADYITKPFRLRELLARVKRTLNTQSNAERPVLLTIGKITIDTAAGKAFTNNTLLDLTAQEYRLLLTFAQNKGQMLTRAQLLDNIWDSASNFVEDNTLTVYIKRLREKLGDAINIQTVRGLGYRVD